MAIDHAYLGRRAFLAGSGALMAVGSRANGAEQLGLPNGWRIPAEDAPHTRTFMQWPVHRAVYPNKWFLRDTQETIARIANTIADFEPVVMLADRADHAKARQLLSGRVDLWDIPTEDLWARDAGPVFATHPRDGLGVVSFNFNGWGRKQVHSRDAKIARRVAEHMGLPVCDSGLVGEAGGVDWDGRGTLIAHASSWDIANRNRMARGVIEARLKAAWGASRVIWAPGLKGLDLTDYHIDSLARFLPDGRVLVNLPHDDGSGDPFVRAAYQTRDILRGAGLRLIEIAEPVKPRVSSPYFVAAYANFYVCNGAVICAQCGDPKADARAAAALRDAYPGREIIALNVDILGELGGGIHCATQQQPKA